tara:strand:- start:40 stop:273 length:234 start_codon:yes stop_codon:yes gene_type:complete
MVTFHYIICNQSKKDRYQVKKLIFIDQKLEKSDDFSMNEIQILNLKNDLKVNEYTSIDEDKIDLESFLRNVNLYNNN